MGVLVTKARLLGGFIRAHDAWNSTYHVLYTMYHILTLYHILLYTILIRAPFPLGSCHVKRGRMKRALAQRDSSSLSHGELVSTYCCHKACLGISKYLYVDVGVDLGMLLNRTCFLQQG